VPLCALLQQCPPLPPAPTGLVAFDFPLAYLSRDKLNQPIFGCNNLSGGAWA